MKQLSSNGYHFKISWKEMIFFIFLWVLIYFEPIAIGPLKISQLWKTIVVIVLFFYVIKRKLPVFIWIGFWFSLKFLVYTHLPYDYLRSIQDALESSIFPLFLAIFYLKYRNRPDSTGQLIHISLLLSLFIIFSTVPFLFGLESLNPVRGLASFGLEENATTGLFYSAAGSSKLFVISTIVLLNTYGRFSNRFLSRIIWILAVLFGVYFVYTSWTRTGWFIFCGALLVTLYFGANIKRKIVAAAFSVLLLVGAIWLYDISQAFRWRLTGGATYRQDTEMSFQQLAKARMPFIAVAIDNLKDEGLGGQVIGYGTQRSIDLFEQKTGMAIVSHNRTFEILESGGIVALLLYFTFIGSLFYNIFAKLKNVSSEIRRLTVASIFIFFCLYITSHGTPFWGEIIFAPIFIAVYLENNCKQSNIS